MALRALTISKPTVGTNMKLINHGRNRMTGTQLKLVSLDTNTGLVTLQFVSNFGFKEFLICPSSWVDVV